MAAKKEEVREPQSEMRLDKFLKVSRIIKRRSVANDACDSEHVSTTVVLASPARR